MKLILRISNLFPLYLALLIVNTAFKLGWQHVAANAKSRWVTALAGAAAYQAP